MTNQPKQPKQSNQPRQSGQSPSGRNRSGKASGQAGGIQNQYTGGRAKSSRKSSGRPSTRGSDTETGTDRRRQDRRKSAGSPQRTSGADRAGRGDTRVCQARSSTAKKGSATSRRPKRRYNQEVPLNLTNLPNFSPQLSRASLRSVQGQPVIKTKKKRGKALKVIPLGGLCEIGKNMTLYEYGNDMIIVDIGVAFPEETQPGIDSVIPDMTYVLENRNKLRGIFLTHGHEDHIGSLAYLLKSVDVPVYGGRLTMELVDFKIEEKGIRGRANSLRVIQAGEKIRAGCFEVEAIHVNHSIADAFAFAIDTPAGMCIHSGDFKIDYTPIHGKPIDLRRFAALGEKGVLLFMCESTNIEREGFSSSEKTVGEAFSKHFEKAKGRILVATFSSNVHRVQQVITAAEQNDRKVALVGRSMLNVCRAANNIGYLDMKPGTLIDVADINQYPPEKLVIITTGSQGEPLAALTRMAFSEHRFVEINSSDTVIISAAPIPGNEKPIYRVINELYKRGAKVVYSDLADIHVSGHAYREEIKILHQLIHPKYFLPGHGEYRHLYMHAQLSNEMGQPWNSIYLLNNGDIFQISQDDTDEAGIVGYAQAEAIMIDGAPDSTVDTEVLNQRKTLSDDGVITVALAVDVARKRLLGEPVVHTRGFIYEKDIGSINQTIIKRVNQFVNKAKQSDQPFVPALRSNALRNQLQSILYSHTHRRPVLLLSIIEV